jgi:hypothetical protein|tara:strand:+ start:406 stop:786 length:381 start_codon:yes stop_codon:yes gene_type:complete
MLMTSLAGSLAPFSYARAHSGPVGDDGIGDKIFWVYGVLLIGLASFVVYRKLIGGREPPERRALKRRLGELQRAHASCLKQLQNAEDYPKECGLTGEQRRDRVESVALIRRRIDETKADLAVPSSR